MDDNKKNKKGKIFAFDDVIRNRKKKEILRNLNYPINQTAKEIYVNSPLCVYNEILKDPKNNRVIPGVRLLETIEKIKNTGINPDKVDIVLENMLKKDLHEFKWVLKENLEHLIKFGGKKENMDPIDQNIFQLQKVLADTNFKECIEKYGNLGLLGVAEAINEIEEETGLKYLVNKEKIKVIVDVKEGNETKKDLEKYDRNMKDYLKKDKKDFEFDLFNENEIDKKCKIDKEKENRLKNTENNLENKKV